MPETIAQAQIDIVVNTRGLVSEFNRVKRTTDQQAGLISKQFVTQFNSIANSAKKMAGVIQSALKAVTGPALAASGYAVKKLFDSTSQAGIDTKMRWAQVKKGIDENIVRIGYYITNSKIFGKTMFEWLDKFGKTLSKVTSQDVQKFVNLLSKALGTIAGITLAVKGISFGQGLIKLLSVIGGGKFLTGAAALGATTAGSGIGSFVGSTVSAFLANKLAALKGVPNFIQTKALNAATNSILTDSALKTMGKLFVSINNFLTSGGKLATILNVLTNSVTGVWALISKSPLLRLGVIGGAAAALTVGALKLRDKIFYKDEPVNYVEAFSNRWLSGKNADEAKISDNLVGHKGTIRGRLPGETELEQRLRFREQRLETVEQAAAQMRENMEKEMERAANYAEKIKNDMEETMDKILENNRQTLDREKLLKQYDADKVKLSKDAEEIAKDVREKRQQEKESLDNFSKSFSGQFVGGEELPKFAQRIESEGARKIEEYNKNMLTINKDSDQKLGDIRTAIKIMNEKMEKFLKLITMGLDPSDVAQGVGL